jgi:lysophospholipid hydrolase
VISLILLWLIPRDTSLVSPFSSIVFTFEWRNLANPTDRGIYKAFYNTHIEDFWIPFFANSTNITHSRMEVHRSGYAWYVALTPFLPSDFLHSPLTSFYPLLTIRRYVRASMTLAGLLPPLSDNGNSTSPSPQHS